MRASTTNVLTEKVGASSYRPEVAPVSTLEESAVFSGFDDGLVAHAPRRLVMAEEASTSSLTGFARFVGDGETTSPSFACSSSS